MRTLEIYAGNEITSAIKTAIADAQAKGDECQFEFNGVTVVVSGASDPDLIYRDWSRGLSGYLGDNPTVGPYPKPELSEAEKASDATIKAANDRKRAERQAEFDKEQAAKSLILQGALSVAGPIELIDEASWHLCKEKNTDPYGGRVIRYAEEWARLMQTRISNGETVAECADELSHLADDSASPVSCTELPCLCSRSAGSMVRHCAGGTTRKRNSEPKAMKRTKLAVC